MKHLMLLLFIIINANVFSQNFSNQNYVQVIGQSEIEIIPDEIYLQIIINEQDNKGKESLESLEIKMLNKLKVLNINIEEDLSIKDFSSNFQKYFLKQTGILTSKEYQLILHDSQTTGTVFQALESVGISNISIKKVDHSKIKEFESTARTEAISDAKVKANGLAVSIQQGIGKAIYIHEFENYNPRPMMGMSAGINLKRIENIVSTTQPDIEFEKIKIESKVEVYFELK